MPRSNRSKLALIGNQPIQTHLQKAVKNGIVPHAQLWVGPEHVGKTTFFENYLDQLQVDRRVSVQMVDGTELDMETARGFIQSTTETSLWAGRRFIVISQAERLRYQVYNALLKVLEEPRSQVSIVLLATQVGTIPATVQSRCTTIWFQRVSDEELLAAVPELAALVPLAHGLPGQLLSWKKASASQRWIQQLMEWADLLQQPPAERMGKATDKDLFPVLRSLEATLYSVLTMQTRAQQYPAELSSALHNLASRVAVSDTTTALQRVAEVRRSLAHPVQPKLVMTNLLLNIYTHL
jgi:DNA polymerase III gamma/tau subunit